MKSHCWLTSLVNSGNRVNELGVRLLRMANVVDHNIILIRPPFLAQIRLALICLLVMKNRPVNLNALTNSFADDLLL